MTNPTIHRPRATTPQPKDAFVSDDWFIDDEFDDFLDLQVATIRESLADFRDFS